MDQEPLDMESAMRTAWSLARLQWEANIDDVVKQEQGDTIVEMLEANGFADAHSSALALAVGLINVAGTLAVAMQIQTIQSGLSLGSPKLRGAKD